ncbi:MAG: GntR family transcriptional regulator [Pseudomonadota bacterium]
MSTSRKTSLSTPLSREGNLSERIYAELRLRLQQVPLKEDERLLDVDVASTYGTSRMPARDALLRLVNEGYLVGTTRGFVAPVLSEEDMHEIFDVRRLLEPDAIASVARAIDAPGLKALTKALQQARRAAKANDGEEMMLANMAFRHAWLSRVANKRLAATIARFVDHVQTVRLNTLSDAQTRQIVLDGLERLHAALGARDDVRVREEMKDFMDAAEHAFFFGRESGDASASGQAADARSVPEPDTDPIATTVVAAKATAPARRATRKVH